MYHGDDLAQQQMQAHLEADRAISKMKDNKRQMDELGTSIARLDMIVCAMWELMQENGITTDALHAKIDDLILRRKQNIYSTVHTTCPKCGKPIQESTKTPMLGRCVYCGELVTFYPYSDEIKGSDGTVVDQSVKDEEEEVPEKEEPKPYDVSDDLGF
ncbi:hypothetical protein SAMN02910456_00404 [Ruminococcaceae bacterium YRB3002]|nr:hypothetical protein SAMN02910456_00404 [Ruminococcaceae bacterium YRB3002]